MTEIGRPDSWLEPDEEKTHLYEVVKTKVYEIEAVNEDEALRLITYDTPSIDKTIEITKL